jgi:hypothetical protein
MPTSVRRSLRDEILDAVDLKIEVELVKKPAKPIRRDHDARQDFEAMTRAVYGASKSK